MRPIFATIFSNQEGLEDGNSNPPSSHDTNSDEIAVEKRILDT